MQLFSLLDPFFNALNDGKIIRFVVAGFLRLVAVLIGVANVIAAVVIIGGAFRTTEVGTVMGSLLLGAFFLASTFCQVAVYLYRARTIAGLGESQFTVTAIASVLFRLIGEMIFCSFTLLGIGGCLFVWMTNMDPVGMLGAAGSFIPRLGVGGGFLGGLTFLATALILGFVLIITFYFIAELLLVLVDIAGNTKALRIAMAGGLPAVPAAVHVPPAPAPEQPAVPQPAPSTVPMAHATMVVVPPPPPARQEPVPAPDPTRELVERLAASGKLIASARQAVEGLRERGALTSELSESAAKMQAYLDGALQNLDRHDLDGAKHFADWADYEAGRVLAAS
ncbi:MAG TPA: hypothetical protein VNX18_02080 [Bryobacteraceae bacterium]|nr:hypothetical protein [Bryobacteraceae bacterium]